MRKKNYFLGLLTFAIISPLFAQDNMQMSTGNDAGFSKKLMEGVNTTYPDIRPLVSADGNSLYFSRRMKPGTAKKEADEDIYVVYKDPASGSWGEPEALPKSLNNKRSNAVVSVKPDGEELILFNTYRSTEDYPLVRTTKEENRWKSPEGITIRDFQNLSPYADFFMDYEQEVLLLAIQPDTRSGEQDLFVAFPDGENAWTKPLHMGPVLNSTKADFAPFMGGDGRTLFFSSYGHDSQGGSDIFMSVRLDDSWTNWSEPVNLGTAINTADEENYFSMDKEFEHLYYTSQKAGEDHWKMFEVKLPEGFTAINGPVLSRLNSEEIRKIMDSGNYTIDPEGAKTNAEGVAFAGWPEDPEIVAAEEETAAVEAEDGSMSADAASLHDYLQQALPGTELDVRVQGDTTEFKLVQNILYAFNSTEANGEYQQSLENIARALKSREGLNVRLIGHTDNIGSEEVNERIAMLRANNAGRALTNMGISENRIELTGAGQNEPVASNETNEGRKQNRRVETIIRYVEN